MPKSIIALVKAKLRIQKFETFPKLHRFGIAKLPFIAVKFLYLP